MDPVADEAAVGLLVALAGAEELAAVAGAAVAVAAADEVAPLVGAAVALAGAALGFAAA